MSIKRLPELRGVEHDLSTGLRLGALTTLHELARSPVLRGHYPILANAAARMASEQIRSIATLGGNLCNAAPSADLAPPLLALDAEARIVGPEGERRIPLEDFFRGPGESTLGRQELLREILVPPVVGDSVYLRHAPRAYMDIAAVGVAVRLDQVDGYVQDARIALGAVAPVPMRMRRAEQVLVRNSLSAERIERAANLAAQDCSPIDDVRASAWYRRRLVQVLTRRALRSPVETDPVWS